MLRYHFTSDDLARVRVAAAPNPLWEVLLSLHVLPPRAGPAVFGGWREQVRPRLDRSLRMLRTLAPSRGYSPDFLTPAGDHGDLEQGLEQLRGTPRHQLRRQLTLLVGPRRPPAWMRRLADADAASVGQLAAGIETYFQRALAPFWNQVQGHIDADRAGRARAMLSGGHDGLLSTLHPSVRWRSPVLEVEYPVERDVRLGGRGLPLVPSFFCWGRAITVADPALPPVLVYPVEPTLGWSAGAAEGQSMDRGPRLAALLGRTRAAVLRTTADGATTGELARRLCISPASASEHLSVLRDAGLTVARRQRSTVWHTATPLGLALLHGGKTPSDTRR